MKKGEGLDTVLIISHQPHYTSRTRGGEVEVDGCNILQLHRACLDMFG